MGVKDSDFPLFTFLLLRQAICQATGEVFAFRHRLLCPSSLCRKTGIMRRRNVSFSSGFLGPRDYPLSVSRAEKYTTRNASQSKVPNFDQAYSSIFDSVHGGSGRAYSFCPTVRASCVCQRFLSREGSRHLHAVPGTISLHGHRRASWWARRVRIPSFSSFGLHQPLGGLSRSAKTEGEARRRG